METTHIFSVFLSETTSATGRSRFLMSNRSIPHPHSSAASCYGRLRMWETTLTSAPSGTDARQWEVESMLGLMRIKGVVGECVTVANIVDDIFDDSL